MTSKIYAAVMAGTAVLAATVGATSANAATDTATARARILQALTLANVDDLDFGAVVASAAAGTVQIDALGGRTCGGGITCSGTVGAADFTLSGAAGEIVAVNADASVTLTSGANSMTASLVESAATVTLDGVGAGGFSVGGTLSVGASQAQGLYSGTFNVNADYQ